MLIMIARPSHRLPATIASRCLRLDSAAAVDGGGGCLAVRQTLRPANAWGPALALAGGAPLLALQLDGAGLAALDADMRQSMAELARGAVDVTLLAERWVRSNPGRAYHLA